jgi:RNA-directed DNA polymerase
MSWSLYAKRFKKEAEKQGYGEGYVKRCLSYAKPLYTKGLPVIYTQEHLAVLVGYSVEYLWRASNGTDHFYRKYKIPKVAGGFRQIAEPLPSLKEIQRWILDHILYRCDVSKFAKAFIPKISIRDNARFHRRQPMVLSLDIEDFFGSISAARVYRLFERTGYCKPVTTMLTRLCTLDGSLPQGAPTSPALSNLISLRLDRRLAGYALKNGIRYTRYADDLTFSGNFNAGSVIRFVERILLDEGLKLNVNKTRLMLKHNRQEVTGIVVNDGMQALRYVRRKLRQDIYHIDKYGIDSHILFTGKTKANYVNHLRGIANFVLFVNPKDRDGKRAIKVLANL